jgi:Rho-type GTPase-activating protein 1/2
MDGDLTSRCEFENADIPTLVIRCVQEIEARGMDEEGLYRKSGGKTQITELANNFEQSSDFDVSDPEIDIASITSLLKQYFRHLCDPLITFGFYADFINTSKLPEDEDRGLAMKKVVDCLPKHHRICLEFIIFHLVRVLAHEAQTKVCYLAVIHESS